MKTKKAPKSVHEEVDMGNEEISKELFEKAIPMAFALHENYFLKRSISEVDTWQNLLKKHVDKDLTIQDLLFILDMVKTMLYQPQNLEMLRVKLKNNSNN